MFSSGCTGRSRALLRGWEDRRPRGRGPARFSNLFHPGLQTRPWPSERLASHRKRLRTSRSHAPAAPVPPAGCPGPAWPWHAGLVPSRGRPGRARPRGRGTTLQSVAVYHAIHVHLGVLLILVTRKPLPTPFCPFGAISLRWCPRYHVSSQVASLARRSPSALRRGLRSTLRASRPDVVLHGGAFYIQLYYFYYYETFPPNSSINTAFQLCGWFWWVAGKE